MSDRTVRGELLALGGVSLPSPALMAQQRRSSASGDPDLVVFNGSVITVDSGQPCADAIAVKSGRFVDHAPSPSVIRSMKEEASELLLPELVTRVTTDGCFVLLVAVDARLHFERLLKGDDLLRGDVAVAARALDFCRGMRAVAEEYEIRQLVDELQWDLPVCHVHVTGLALR